MLYKSKYFVLLFFSILTTVYGQDSEISFDTIKYKLLGRAGEDIHFLYIDTIKGTCKNYDWPSFEIDLISGFGYSNWITPKPDYKGTISLLKFSDKFDGINRFAEMGNYEIEAKYNLPRLEFSTSYYSHYIKYKPSVQQALSTLVYRDLYEGWVQPDFSKELRLGIGYVFNHKQSKSNKLFNSEQRSFSHKFLTDYSHTIGNNEYYKNKKDAFYVNNIPAVEEIITNKQTAIKVGYVRLAFPYVYEKEAVYLKLEDSTRVLTNYFLHWDNFTMNGINIGFMYRIFKRYEVKVDSPVKRQYGLGWLSNDYRCTSTEYGANLILGSLAASSRQLPFNVARTGFEAYLKQSWEPMLLKVSGGKMIGKENEWCFRFMLGITIRGKGLVLESKVRNYSVQDYLD